MIKDIYERVYQYVKQKIKPNNAEIARGNTMRTIERSKQLTRNHYPLKKLRVIRKLKRPSKLNPFKQIINVYDQYMRNELENKEIDNIVAK
ncbi:hypothetical protein [Enterococcus faecalis]|uniref:hypothetical protein n=1 Tax=Enterococcus faecalis TaxID=1351 RepID=UPI003CC6475E